MQRPDFRRTSGPVTRRDAAGCSGNVARRCLLLRRWIFFLSAFLGLPFWLSAQRYNFEYYSHGDGLGDMEVHSLVQDRTGFIWIGTASGLYRYDGGHFRGLHGV